MNPNETQTVSSVVPPAIETPIAPAPARRTIPDRASSSVLCECCGCTLTLEGDVMRRGDRAASWLRLEDKVADLKAEIETRDAEIRHLKAMIDDYKKVTTPATGKTVVRW